MRSLILLLFLNCFNNVVWGQNPNLRRICPNGKDNELFWNNPNYGCLTFWFYIIWERKGNTGPFLPIDTIYNLNTSNYLHANATPPLSEPNSYYFIERRDSCTSPYNHYSDTLLVDVIPPNITELDSVSVDIVTNKVVLGWRKNTSPDFDKYMLYYLDGGFFVAMTPSETRDTFVTDLGSKNPSSESISYNINTRDSCGKSPAYEKKHSTIYLKTSIDTCAKTSNLTWSHYIGWNAIAKYYIFCKINSGNYSLIDSVIGSQNSYTTPILLGNTYTYFVRSIKDTAILISSSSNTASVTSRLRIDPTSSYIKYVTTDLSQPEKIEFSFSTTTNEEASSYKVKYFNKSLSNVGEISLSKNDLNTQIETGIINNDRYLFFIESYDLCDALTKISDTSTNILLAGKDSLGIRLLNWNSYFTWNTGVKDYIIYRGTGSNGNISFSNLVTITDTNYIDTETGVNIQSDGLCYYVVARNNADTTIVSKSNTVCLSANFVQYIPNAFAPAGYNKTFKPIGSLINEKLSRMKIYNRWGMLIFESDLVQGWDGKDNSGNICQEGIYFYQIDFISTKNEQKSKNGTVTLLR